VCSGTVVHTLDRSQLSLVQTPQAFRLDVILRAHREALTRGYRATDDCALVESLGLPVEVVPGDRRNIKITTIEDMADAEAVLRRMGESVGETVGEMAGAAPRATTSETACHVAYSGSAASFRIGQGFDIHRTATGRRLVLGGVEIPHPMGLGLAGHSDADVVAHAVADAMLGAAGLGDIGRHFPDTDPRYENADSMELLSQVTAMCRAAGYSVVNCDVTIIAQTPKVSRYSAEMASRLARAMETAAECVNIKGKTTEMLGAIGRSEAIACSAVVLAVRQE
ncbi:MAG: 2-C-methyl-D-erythritol 2,4-cyclodiphosphate synthase, partial [Dehalococcoidia bacterium]|nr:2-C-methyl-D-erythritol 2,4-cyclodiphosphate synthase [Dehalococcoidia bacterium]